jgi:uncharacterized protein
LNEIIHPSRGLLARFVEKAGLSGPYIKYWYLYVSAFYVVWTVLVTMYGHWAGTIAHWPIAVVMILGSVVAGSTPMGGGTVAFPVLVLLFGQSANIGRNFGMAIQALGMTSAMIFILCRKTPIQKSMVAWAALGAAAGLLLGTFVVSPLLSGRMVKLLFSTVWVNFGIMTLLKNREICGLKERATFSGTADVAKALSVGLLGGMVNSIIGVGIEMILYAVLVLRFRCDVKIAVPTAVSMGAVTSLMAIALHALIGDIGMEVFYNWMAAGPIVVFGAPLGAFLVSVIPRVRTLYFVALLCILQFVWTLSQVLPQAQEWFFVALIVVAANLAFHFLYSWGRATA